MCDSIERGFEVFDVTRVYQYSMSEIFAEFFDKMMAKRREADARGDKVFVKYYKAVGLGHRRRRRAQLMNRLYGACCVSPAKSKDTVIMTGANFRAKGIVNPYNESWEELPRDMVLQDEWPHRPRRVAWRAAGPGGH